MLPCAVKKIGGAAGAYSNVTAEQVGEARLAPALRPGRQRRRRRAARSSRDRIRPRRARQRARGAETGERHHPSRLDAGGAPVAYRDPVGEVTSTTTDRIGRPLVRTYADGTTETFGYDGPRLLSTTDRQGRQFTYVWNDRGQVSELRAGGGALLEKYAYDDAGRLTRRTTREADDGVQGCAVC